MIAALYVEANGCYAGLPGVDAWPETRDARLYSGPHPVVAHPPCQRWGRFWHGSTRKPHQFKLGADNGCFAAALRAVRMWGGVLEHPAHSRAWDAFGIRPPSQFAGWQQADFDGWTCCVEQGHYGHMSRKLTWLYAAGVDLPELNWSKGDGRRQAENRNPQRHTAPVPRPAAVHRVEHAVHAGRRMIRLLPVAIAAALIAAAAYAGALHLPGCGPRVVVGHAIELGGEGVGERLVRPTPARPRRSQAAREAPHPWPRWTARRRPRGRDLQELRALQPERQPDGARLPQVRIVAGAVDRRARQRRASQRPGVPEVGHPMTLPACTCGAPACCFEPGSDEQRAPGGILIAAAVPDRAWCAAHWPYRLAGQFGALGLAAGRFQPSAAASAHPGEQS